MILHEQPSVFRLATGGKGVIVQVDFSYLCSLRMLHLCIPHSIVARGIYLINSHLESTATVHMYCEVLLSFQHCVHRNCDRHLDMVCRLKGLRW